MGVMADTRNTPVFSGLCGVMASWAHLGSAPPSQALDRACRMRAQTMAYDGRLVAHVAKALLPTKMFIRNGEGLQYAGSHLRLGGEIGELLLLVGGLSRATQRLAVHPRF